MFSIFKKNKPCKENGEFFFLILGRKMGVKKKSVRLNKQFSK